MASESIVFLLEAKDLASKSIEKVGTSAASTSTKMDKFHKVGAAAGVALAGGLVLAGKAAIDFTKEAAANQQSAALMARVLHTAAGATKEQTAATEEWITKQGESYGIAKNDLRPALSKLAVATGSVTKAQKLASLAMDVSAGTGKNLQSVAFALAKAQTGNVSGLARLGIATTKTTKNTLALSKAQTAVKSATLTYTAAIKAHGKGSVEASIALDKLKQAHAAVTVAQSATTKTTLSLDEITKNLSKTYSGAAAKSANTAAGKQKILTFEMEELRVKIGTALIPIMLKLTTVGMKVVDWITKNTRLVGIIVGTLGTLAAVTWAVSAATKAWAAITKVATAAQWLFNAAMDANPISLVVIGLAALAVALVVAYKKSATFRAIVQGALHGVETAAMKVVHFFTKDVPKAFDKVKTAASSALGWVKSNWPKILAVLAGPFGLLVLAIAKNWAKIKAGALATVTWFKQLPGKIGSALGNLASTLYNVAKDALVKMVVAERAGILNVLKAVKAVPGKVKSAIGNLGNLLKSAGVALIQGLISGITSKVSDLMSTIGGLAGKVSSAFKKPLGIFSPSKVFRSHGQALMDGLLQGIADRQLTVQTAMSKVAGLIQNSATKISGLMSKKQGFLQTFTGDSVFGADLSQTTTDAQGNQHTTPGTLQDLIAFQKKQAHKAHRFMRDVRKVTQMGLSKDLIKQLQSQGEAGAAQLHLIAQGDPAQIKRLNALNRQTNQSLQAAGLRAGNYVRGGSIGADIALAKKQEHVLEQLEHHLRDLAHSQKKGETIVVKIGEEAIIQAIIRRNKRKGVRTAGV